MKVPGNVVQMPRAQPQVDPIYLQLAASMMHSEGKLGPKPTMDLKPHELQKEGIERRRDESDRDPTMQEQNDIRSAVQRQYDNEKREKYPDLMNRRDRGMQP